jgi:DHA1 family bicyclomycin/chloramphenicol resistance-like MFS transporter
MSFARATGASLSLRASVDQPEVAISRQAKSLSEIAHAAEESRKAPDWRIFIVLSAIMALGAISTDVYLPAMPALSEAFHTGAGQVQMTLTSYLIGFSLGQLLWGPIGDRYGRLNPIAAGIALFIIGSVGCAMSGSASQMTAWRVLQAVGACAGPVLTRAMVRDLFDRERAAQMLSTLMLIMGVAPLLGPLVGGQILTFWSWQGIFWSLAAFGVLTLVGSAHLWETLPTSKRNREPLTAALAEYIQLARSRQLFGYALSGGFFYGGVFAYLAGTPFAYIEYYHVPPQDYGLLFGVNIVGMMAANLLNARLVMRLGAVRIFRFGTCVAALAAAGLALNIWFDWGLAGLAAALFFYVSALGFIVANSIAGALSAFPRAAGSASALLGAFHFGFGMLAVVMVGWLADGTPRTMALIVAACGVGCFVSALLLVRRS